MNPVCESTLKGMIQKDESVLWTGSPEPGLHLQQGDAFMIPFSIFWCGFVLFWELGVLQTGALPMAVFGLPFIAMGFYLAIGRYIHAAYCASRTLYAVTDRRILFVTTKGSRFLRISQLPSLEIQIRRSGLGTVSFQRKSPQVRTIRPFAARLSPEDCDAFENIRDTQEVYNLIEAQMMGKK